MVRCCFVLTCVLLAHVAHAAQSPAPVFTRDIAPIIATHCASCHQPGDSAPFSLLTFEDVRSRARLIREVTRTRYMPPWRPEPNSGGPFLGERRLTAQQIDIIARWVDAGAPAGDQTALPATARPIATSAGWRLGAPDLVIELSEPYELPADGADEFRNFVIRIPTTTVRYVAGIEFRPGATAVHHANLRLDRTSSSRELDAVDPLSGYEGPPGANARYPDGYFLGWTPGQLPPLAAKGMAWRLEPGTDLLVQLHLRKTGKVERIQPRVGFFFTDDAPTRLPLALRLGRQSIDLAPDERTVVRDSFTLPVNVEVHAIHPHAHYRARDVKAYADLPDGSRRWLMHIRDWDFNWQDVYRYVNPVALPRGSTIVSEFEYDNSTANSRNPDRPPRRVIFGQNSSDEMGDLWLQVLPESAADRARLVADVVPKGLAEDAAGYGMLLSMDPNNAALKQSKAATHYNLGSLFAARGQAREAVAEFRHALALRPEHSQTHNNLGVVLTSLGQLDEEIEHLRRAVALDPSNAEAKTNLAVALKNRR
jgi:tetratricopeptide (TPR) repeat protein/mono/diheme cytochrome c family protein